MSIGLTKEVIVSMLLESKGAEPEILFNKIAEIIVKNNAVIEKKIPDVVGKDFISRAGRLGKR